MKYNVSPNTKPRMTRADKWKKRKCVLQYWAFKDEINLRRVKFEVGQSIIFHVPMPKSWSKKKKIEMDGRPHEQVPDIDNYLKALFDSLYLDDSHIWHVGDLKKLWAYEGSIEIY